MLWTFYVGFSHLPMSMGHHSTTRPAISVVSLRKAQCQAYLISSFLFLFRFVDRHRTQYTLYVFVVVVAMWNQSQMKYMVHKSLIDAPVQPSARFWSFTLEKQREGATFTICVETLKCHCIVLSVRRRRHPFVLVWRVNGELVWVGIVCEVHTQCTASKITFNMQNWLCWRYFKMNLSYF